MPFNVLILPLLGGYFFVTHWNCTRFVARRSTGERLLFYSAAAGVVFLVIAFVITRLLLIYFPGLDRQWHDFVGFEYAGTSLLALTMGVSVWWPLNELCFERPKEAIRVLTSWNNFLELLLYKAQDDPKLVLLTLSNRKVYIGAIVSSFDPVNDRKYIEFLPMRSGYRTEDSLEMVLTTDYTDVYAMMIRDDPRVSTKGIEDFRIVIPVAEVVTVSYFDPKIYEMFNPSDAEEVEPAFP